MQQQAAVEVTNADLSVGALRKTSYIRIGRSMVVHQSLLKPVGSRLKPEKLASVHKAIALQSTRQFSRLKHGSLRPAADPDRQPWEPGSTIPYACRVFTEEEVEAAVSSTLDFWLTLGLEVDAFQRDLAEVGEQW